jgi:hypothetical protein
MTKRVKRGTLSDAAYRCGMVATDIDPENRVRVGGV